MSLDLIFNISVWVTAPVKESGSISFIVWKVVLYLCTHVQNDLTLQVKRVIGSYVLNLWQPNLAYFQCIEVFNVFVNDETTFFLQTEDSDKEEPDNKTGELVQQAAVSVESEQNPEESVDKPEDEPEPEPEEDMADTVSGVVCNESDLKDGE